MAHPSSIATDAEIVAAHERRLAALDPLLCTSHPLPKPEADDTLLRVEGAVGLLRCHRPDPESFIATWGAAEQHQLRLRVGGPDPVAAMGAVLDQWRERVLAQVTPGDPETEANLTWPSRDTVMTPQFLAHRLRPGAVIAARPAGRPSPGETASAGVRPIRAGDLDAAVAMWLALARWDAQFGVAVERPSTAAAIRRELAEVCARDEPWAWVAEPAGGQLTGLLVVSPPERAEWIAPLTSASPVAYLGCMMVTDQQRGGGIGTALVRQAHAALDAAGVAVTLLHYAALSPLSGPFWHRCGYRPLWSIWEARPASQLS